MRDEEDDQGSDMTAFKGLRYLRQIESLSKLYAVHLCLRGNLLLISMAVVFRDWTLSTEQPWRRVEEPLTVSYMPAKPATVLSTLPFQ